MEDWAKSTDRYLRKWLDGLASIERICGFENGGIGKEAANYERYGFDRVSLADLAAGMDVISTCRMAIEKWDGDARKEWAKHRGRIRRALANQPKPSGKTAKPPKPARGVSPVPKRSRVVTSKPSRVAVAKEKAAVPLPAAKPAPVSPPAPKPAAVTLPTPEPPAMALPVVGSQTSQVRHETPKKRKAFGLVRFIRNLF